MQLLEFNKYDKKSMKKMHELLNIQTYCKQNYNAISILNRIQVEDS